MSGPAELVVEPLHEQRLRLFRAELRDPVQGLALVGEHLLHLLAAAVEVLLLLGEVALDVLEVLLFLIDQLKLLIEQVGPFLETLLVLADLLARVLELGVDGLASAEGVGGSKRAAEKVAASVMIEREGVAGGSND